MSTQVIHNDLITTLGNEAVAYNTVTRDFPEAKLGTAEVALDPESRSPHLTSMIPTGPSWQTMRKSRFHQCVGSREPSISRPLPFAED
jgi:hypothetical protein